MTYKSNYTQKAYAEIFRAEFEPIRKFSLQQAKEHEQTVLVDTKDKLVIDTVYGAYELDSTTRGTKATIHCNSLNSLSVLKDTLVQNLDYFLPGSASSIYWSDNQKSGTYPPNFQFTTVESITRLSERFIRLSLSVEDLSEYTDQSIHFRLVLPPKTNVEVEWPIVRKNGSISWPGGKSALHKPVYTARNINRDEGTLDLDVFLHEGGRVTEWVQSLDKGQTVAIIGPGGGGVPETNEIHMFADETAYPASARILETVHPNTKGSLVLLTEKNCAGDYEFENPAAVKVIWINRDEIEAFKDLAITTLENLGDAYFWYAGEKHDVMAIRKIADEKGVKKEQRYIGSYWSKD